MSEFEFSLGELNFRGGYLSPEASLDAFATVSPVLGEVLEALDVEEIKVEISAEVFVAPLIVSLKKFKDLTKLSPIFAQVYKVQLPGADIFVDLKTFYREAFRGRPVEHVSFLVTCILKEFKDFLEQSGWNTLQQVVTSCGFQIKPLATGRSGD